MKTKAKIGMGMKTKVKTKKKTTKKRVFSTAKRCDILPILPMLDALGSLIGEAAGVAKAVSDTLKSCGVPIVRWKVTDFISLRTNIERDYISDRTNVDRV